MCRATCPNISNYADDRWVYSEILDWLTPINKILYISQLTSTCDISPDPQLTSFFNKLRRLTDDQSIQFVIDIYTTSNFIGNIPTVYVIQTSLP